MKPIKEDVFALCVVLGVLLFFTSLQALGTPQSKNEGQNPKKFLVIAHRGASGYLPEHTLEAKAMAHAMGADYIEQDVVLTKDDQAVVLHDIYLDEVTDVARVFPGRNQTDGRFYAIDFTLAEIKTLNVTERFDRNTGEACYPNRFPDCTRIDFKIPTLAEEIKLIQGLNKSTGKNVGIYVELKKPGFHKKKGNFHIYVGVSLRKNRIAPFSALNAQKENKKTTGQPSKKKKKRPNTVFKIFRRSKL